MGAFVTMNFKPGWIIASAPLIHLRKSELRHPSTHRDELLLNYCYGHPHTSLLFLPNAIGVNYINHDRERANVQLQWNMKERSSSLGDLFPKSSRHMFRSEETKFNVHIVALRDIDMNEEIFLDYGDDWIRAWEQHQEEERQWEEQQQQQQQQHESSGMNHSSPFSSSSSPPPFRHEIGIPTVMFPRSWLAKEKEEMEKESSMGRGGRMNSLSWDTTDLAPGEVQRIKVKETGEEMIEYVHRVGMPIHLATKMLDWSDRLGITDLMKQYVLHGRALPVNGEERHIIDGGTWWLKRFNGYWHSNMHYITPDDAKSDYDFMAALGEAGFDDVLRGIGRHFGLNGLVCYYPSFIAVSHCTGSFLHHDSEPTGGRRFNVIFPLLQVDRTDPELNLRSDNKSVVIPYRYEPHAAVALGDLGYHGTAPCDYRGVGSMRMVVSVYMVDVAEDIIDDVTWDEGLDPPYPPPKTQRRYFLSNAGRDWKKDDPSKRLPRTSVNTMEQWANCE